MQNAAAGGRVDASPPLPGSVWNAFAKAASAVQVRRDLFDEDLQRLARLPHVERAMREGNFSSFLIESLLQSPPILAPRPSIVESVVF